MVEYEFLSTALGVSVIDPAVYATPVVTGTIVDTRGFDSLTFAIQSGVITDGSYQIVIEAGDEPGLSDGVVVGSGNIIGGVSPTFADSDDGVIKLVGTNTKKRFAQLLISGTGISSGGLFSASAILAHKRSV